MSLQDIKKNVIARPLSRGNPLINRLPRYARNDIGYRAAHVMTDYHDALVMTQCSKVSS